MNKKLDAFIAKLLPPPMPTWDEFTIFVLQFLADGKTCHISEIRQGVADLAGLTPAQRAELLPSGQSRAENRIGWALSKLTTAGALERPARGQYHIAPVGQAILQKHPNGVTEDQLNALAKSSDEPWQNTKHDTSGKKATAVPRKLDPVEQIEDSVKRLNDAAAVDLLQRLKTMDPFVFEKAVAQVLKKMGYGQDELEPIVTSKTGDGGIDGSIDMDPLGINRVYFQAKRYTDTSVQRPAVQSFVGALMSENANTGVFVTTSQFSQGAIDYAKTPPVRVVLIDGPRLVELMIQYGVGVQSLPVSTPVKVDEDFFE